jgi:hypothetical protein
MEGKDKEIKRKTEYEKRQYDKIGVNNPVTTSSVV